MKQDHITSIIKLTKKQNQKANKQKNNCGIKRGRVPLYLLVHTPEKLPSSRTFSMKNSEQN